jgi:hypothetical protein
MTLVDPVPDGAVRFGRLYASNSVASGGTTPRAPD